MTQDAPLVNLKRYTLVYVGTILGLVVLSFVLSLLAGISLPAGLSTILPAMAGAMIEGQKRATAGLAPFEKSEAWAAARSLTKVVILVNALIMVLAMIVPSVRAVFYSVPVMAALVFLVLIGITFLTNRFFLTYGFKNQKIALDRKALRK